MPDDTAGVDGVTRGSKNVDEEGLYSLEDGAKLEISAVNSTWVDSTSKPGELALGLKSRLLVVALEAGLNSSVTLDVAMGLGLGLRLNRDDEVSADTDSDSAAREVVS